MATAIINGRRVSVPANTTDEAIRKAGNIDDGRSLIRRTREGNYVVKHGSSVQVKDGEVFTDSPRRVKG